MNPYSYLLIRKDLTGPQQIVQSSHAAHKAGHRFGDHSHLICFGINTENDLLKASDYLNAKGIAHEMFYEPDGGAGYTAICTQPLIGVNRTPMRRFSLLKSLTQQ